MCSNYSENKLQAAEIHKIKQSSTELENFHHKLANPHEGLVIFQYSLVHTSMKVFQMKETIFFYIYYTVNSTHILNKDIQTVHEQENKLVYRSN